MRWAPARAKINLSLHVLGLRLDGYHELESLVAFGGVGDWLGYERADRFDLEVEGPNAGATGPNDDNLVLRAARALASRAPNLKLGRFRLVKLLPAAAGLGGGSADAAAALRLLADANGFAWADERVREAAAASGADVPVCLDSRATTMTGVGERMGPPARLAQRFAVLVNPRVPAATKDVFRVYDQAPQPVPPPAASENAPQKTLHASDLLTGTRNDLESAAITVAPAIRDVLASLARLPGARLSRMSGSGATCFALFDTAEEAASGRLRILAERPEWWAAATHLQ